jgi:hypothetical protein
LIGGTTTAVVLVSPAAWEIVLGMMIVILAEVILRRGVAMGWDDQRHDWNVTLGH